MVNTINDNYENIAVMGGTFDPIHIAHLILAQEVLTNFKMDKIIFMPTGNPPHKVNSLITNANHRFNMTKMAIVQNSDFLISDIEINRIGKTYTYDTFNELKILYPNSNIFFITGSDAILNIEKWKNCETLLKHCNFIVATRPGFVVDKIDNEVNLVNTKYNSNIQTIKTINMDISSSNIRKRIKRCENIKYLVPDNVIEYIKENNLYLG